MKTSIKIFAALFSISPMVLFAQELPKADYVVEQTQKRDDGNHLIQDVKLELISNSGKLRTEETRVYRKYYGEERRQAIFYTYPSNVAGTSFLVLDYPEADKDDDQWLYLPAIRKTRRISAANRGDYFLGTDLTYEDIKLGPKLSDEDYKHQIVGVDEVDGHKCYVIESEPIDEKTKKELGYSKTKAWIDAEIWIVRKGEFWDIAGNMLKTVHVADIKNIQGIWTPQAFHVTNHKTGHKSNFLFSNMDYTTSINDDLFSEQALVRGL